MKRALLLALVTACSHPAAPATPIPAPAPPPAEAATATAPEAGPEAAPEAKPETRLDPAIAAYADVAGKIIAAATADHAAWNKLEYLTDHIGHRLSGTKELDAALKWGADTLRADGHENVRIEKVKVPHWVRGAESLKMTAPFARDLPLIGLGGTVGTRRRGVSAEVVSVHSFDELAALGDKVKGKIVLYDVPMPAYTREKGSGYDAVFMYRYAGPSKAAAQGAVAVLVRSLTTHSLRTPHTGTLGYDDKQPKIPAAAVTVEDAEMMSRLIAAGEHVKVTLRLGAKTLPDAESGNVIGEIVGREKPDEVVVIGAHIDSWDVGQGAHDDGGSCAAVMQALTVLRKLGLQPRRTIRVVLFTNEENGGRGSKGYLARHEGELPNHVMALESDSGSFDPRGFQVSGSEGAIPKLRAIASLLAPIKATEVEKGYSGADVEGLESHGVVGLGLWVDESHYFDYHHTQADTLDKVDPDELARDVAAIAVMAYVVADMPERLRQ